MKRSTVWGLVGIVALVWLATRAGGSGDDPRAAAARAEARAEAQAAERAAEAEAEKAEAEMDEARDAVVEHFKGDAEPKVKDAVWTSDSIFKVGMLHDGSDRSGYAEYVCNVLYEHGFQGKKVWVQVVDIATLVRTDEWVKIGEAHCT